MNWILIMNLLIYVGSVLDIQVLVRLCVPTVDVEFWCSLSGRCSTSSTTTTVRTADESKNGTEKLFVRVLRSKRARNRSTAFWQKKRTNGSAKHTLQIHLPRKILYIISSPEICQINSMNRTSKIGTISKNLNVYFQIFLAIKIYIWMLLSRKCPLEGINWSFYNISLYD